MPRRSQIELQGLVDRIISMFHSDNLSQRDIAQSLQKEGFKISKSGVGRTLQTHASQVAAYRRAAKEAVAIVQELKNNPGLDIAEATVQMVQTRLLNEVKEFDSFGELELKDLIKAVAQNSLCQTRIAKVKLEYEKGYKLGLFKASEVIDKEGQKAGLSEETIAKIKAKVLGLKVAYGEP